MVDGLQVHSVALAWSWSDTDQYLQIGANGWASSDGDFVNESFPDGNQDIVFNHLVSSETIAKPVSLGLDARWTV